MIGCGIEGEETLEIACIIYILYNLNILFQILTIVLSFSDKHSFMDKLLQDLTIHGEISFPFLRMVFIWILRETSFMQMIYIIVIVIILLLGMDKMLLLIKELHLIFNNKLFLTLEDKGIDIFTEIKLKKHQDIFKLLWLRKEHLE